MAVSCAVHVEGGDATDKAATETYVTASSTFASGKTYILAFCVGKAGGVAPASPSSVTGGPTWTAVSGGAIGFDPNSDPTARLVCYKATGGGETSAVTIVSSQTTWEGGVWIIVELTGDDTSAPIVQTVTGFGDSGTALAATLAAFADAANATLAFGSIRANTTIAADTDYTRYGHQVITAPNVRLAGVFRADNDTSVTMTAGTSEGWGVVAMEIKVASVGGAVVPVFMNQYRQRKR